MTTSTFSVGLWNSLIIFNFYLLARNPDLGHQALQTVYENYPQARDKVVYHQLDICSVESIHRFTEYIRKNHGGLDVLINNAAIAFKVISNIFLLISYHA